MDQASFTTRPDGRNADARDDRTSDLGSPVCSRLFFASAFAMAPRPAAVRAVDEIVKVISSAVGENVKYTLTVRSRGWTPQEAVWTSMRVSEGGEGD